MAFSKAKILRFNDISTCAPPPSAYFPKFEDHVPGVKYVKDKDKLLSEPRSPCSSAASFNSGISIASFRTPSVPRRKNIALPNSAGKKKTVFSPQKSEALREKIVECVNKDETIKDLENQLEELKLALSNLNVQKYDLSIERDELAEHVKSVQNELENVNIQLEQKNLDNRKIVDDYGKMEAELKAQNTAEMKQLQVNLDILQERLVEYNAEMEKREEELEDTKLSYNKLEKEFKELSEEYSALKIKYEESLQFQTELKNIHIAEKESLKRLRETEIKELEIEMSKVIANWKETVEKIEKDNENKINNLETEQNLEIKKLNDDFMLEKKKLLTNIDDLKLEVDRLNIELNETKTNLKNEINNYEKHQAAALAEKHCYEITLNKTYDTVNALKNRLLHSDRDVEQLAKELEALEKTKFETESKYIKENEMIKKENEELKSGNEAFIVAIQGNVVHLELELLHKIDNFKSKAESEISRLTSVIDKQSNELKKLHSFIQDQQQINSNAHSLVADARNEIEQLESEASEYKLKISKLEIFVNEKEEADDSIDRQIKELNDKLKERDLEMNELASIYKKYIEKSRDYDQLQQKHEELGQNYGRLENKIAEQDTLIGPFREQLENYERECQVLLLHKDEAEKEAKEMGLKYAQILGHQNYKQKVKHIVDLKKKNIELMECKQNYEAKIMQQTRTIEKLKQKITQMNKTKVIDKENVGSPVRMPIIHSPLALKERN